MKVLLLIIGVLALLALVIAANALVIFWAWNLVVPALFGLSPLTFWQAVGLWLLLATVAGTLRASVGARRD